MIDLFVSGCLMERRGLLYVHVVSLVTFVLLLFDEMATSIPPSPDSQDLQSEVMKHVAGFNDPYP